MQKDRGFKIIAVIALIFAVAGLTIAYASYSTTLTIKGDSSTAVGTVSSKWDIHFDTTKGVTATPSGDATDSGSTTTESTTISGIDFTFSSPGDSVSYEFDVVNGGNLDAKISSISGGAVTCDATAETQKTAVCGAITKTLKYSDDTDVAADDELDAGDSVTMVLTFEFDSDFDTELTEDVTVNMSDLTITYVQNN